MQRKHEGTTMKSAKYTVNKHKLTSLSAVFQPRSTFAGQQHGRTLLQRTLGAFTNIARYSRELYVTIFAR